MATQNDVDLRAWYKQIETPILDGLNPTSERTAGVADETTTTISITPSTVTANGTSQGSITVQAKDSVGTNLMVGGDTVTLAENGSATISSITDNSDGTYSATIVNSTVEEITVSGTINSSAITTTSPTVDFVASASFPLDTGHFIAAKMPMVTVYPRPDTETQSHARHRLMHTVMSYEVPVGVQGGAWPFQYSIIEAPSGSAIGADYGDSNYGILTVPAQASGSHDITVRVTDQELNTIDIVWSATVDDTAFVFIEDGYAGTQSGTITEPLEDFDDYYLGDEDDSTYANKVLVFRAGAYILSGDSSRNDNADMNTGVKATSMISYPSEAAVLDFTAGQIFIRGGTNAKDIFVYGMTCENARTTVTNSHFFWCTGSDLERTTFANNYLDTLEDGTSGDDNACGIFISNTSANKNYTLIKQNTCDNFTNTGSNGGYFDLYSCSYVLIEENKCINSSNFYGIWAKGTTAFCSIRANEVWDGNLSSGIVVGYGDESRSITHDHEVCWNRIVLPASSSRYSILWSMAPQYQGQFYNSYMYRNTFVKGFPDIRFLGAENYVSEDNVVVSDDLNLWDTSLMDQPSANITDTETGNVTTNATTGLLIGTARTNYLGTKGHEVD